MFFCHDGHENKIVKGNVGTKRKRKIFSSNMIQQCRMKCWIRFPGPKYSFSRYQTFFSPQVKRSMIISNKDGIWELPYILPNDVTIRILGN